MSRIFGLLILWIALGAAESARSGYHLIPGSFEPNRGPDGNSVFLEAPQGLILVDTGRHPEHRGRLLAYARERGRPIAAIVNTHWHLDHASGNGEIMAAHPGAPLYATNAVDRAIGGFMQQSREQMQARLAAGQVPAEREAEVRRFLALMDDPAALRPTRSILASADMTIAGRPLRLNVARFAATEADLWIHDPAQGLVIVGDLVVSEVPFMDTACPEGWRRALEEIERTPFTTLVPGHGEPMDRAAFLAWKTAFDQLLDCAASSSSREACIAGWRQDAGRFIGPGRTGMIDEAVGYYLDNRLRTAPAERDLYCSATEAS